MKQIGSKKIHKEKEACPTGAPRYTAHARQVMGPLKPYPDAPMLNLFNQPSFLIFLLLWLVKRFLYARFGA